ncbi:MAG: glycosyltransferase family 2 protein [Chloroherpetonaceae bacterium]|nr:glycosyltransferase [Chthonomonadaceae bacterium]MDW8209087.1 glycosyltransferase family 2 protein [Chloroherpetonaceae bacterium]
MTDRLSGSTDVTPATPFVSFVIPCFNAADTIQRALDSIGETDLFDLEVIVVDDGSQEPLCRERLRWNVATPLVVVTLDTNRGQPAACNAGFAKSRGDVVVVLDADDALAPGWDRTLRNLLDCWPPESPLAFAWAVTEHGESTGQGRGIYSREQFLAGEGRGEYLPVFRGEVARKVGYIDLGTRKRCGTLSYARILEAGPLYVHPEVMRVYYVGVATSVSKNPFDARKARDSYLCFQAIRQAVEQYDRARGLPAGKYLPELYMKEAIYRAFGESRGSGLGFAWRHRKRLGWRRLALVTVLALLPREVCGWLISRAKAWGVIRAFG